VSFWLAWCVPRTHGASATACARTGYTAGAMDGLRFGQPAPDFALPSSAGGETRLTDFRGHDVVLIFYCFDWGSI